MTWTGRTLAPGSSPRGRGKLIMTKIKRFACRLIPARAGKTSSSRSGRTYRRAHPRAGGENTFFSNVVISPCGSSPRGRGKHCEPVECGVIAGLIPARAGKTCHSGFPLCSYSAHPRAGGENWVVGAFPCCQAGSSPRGRGKRDCHRSRPIWHGLIPARAGKTAPTSDARTTHQAHPRAGGEN